MRPRCAMWGMPRQNLKIDTLIGSGGEQRANHKHKRDEITMVGPWMSQSGIDQRPPEQQIRANVEETQDEGLAKTVIPHGGQAGDKHAQTRAAPTARLHT